MPTVLIYNQYFPPDTSATSLLAEALSDAFAERGWVVKRLRGNPSYRPAERQRWRLGQFFAHSGDDWVVRSTSFTRDRMTGRLANYLSFVVLSFFVALWIRADVIIAMTDPPIVVIPAVVVGRVRKRRVVYWLQDYLPDFLVGTGALDHNALTATWARIHIAAARRCDRVVAIGRDMAARLTDAGVVEELVSVVPNGSAVSWRGPESLTGPPNGTRLRVIHAGEIGMRGAWHVMVEAADQFADCADLVFVGDGVEASDVREMARGKPNVSVQDPVPRNQMPSLLVGADVLIVTVRRGAEGYTVPSKTYELFGAGRPIVVIADAMTEPARLVREIGCGLVASPDDPQEFSDAIRRLATDRSMCSTMGAAARDASPTFERRIMMQKVVGIVSEMLMKRCP